MREWYVLSDLKDHPANPRNYGAAEIARMADSLRKFPEMYAARPIVINKGLWILGGHLRAKALATLDGYREPMRGRYVECEMVDWPEEKQLEFLIRDNSHIGRWDYDTLANVFPTEAVLEWGVVLRELDEKCPTCQKPY